MTKTIFASYLFSVIMMAMCMVSCGGGGDDIINEDAGNYTPSTPSTPQEQPQEEPVIVKDISDVNVDESGNVPTFSFAAPQQVGGKAELIASETRVDGIVILGKYNTDTGCYEFDLSVLESNRLYTFKIKVYDKDGKVVIESSEKTITMPDTSDFAKINPHGESDGTRSN